MAARYRCQHCEHDVIDETSIAPSTCMVCNSLLCVRCTKEVERGGPCPVKTDPDMVNHPPHYNNHPSGVEAIEITEWFSFSLGSAIKYIWRAGEKNDAIEDLKKASWYINREITRLSGLANKEKA